MGLLFFISAVNYLDRQALSILVPTLRVELIFGARRPDVIITDHEDHKTVEIHLASRTGWWHRPKGK